MVLRRGVYPKTIPYKYGIKRRRTWDAQKPVLFLPISITARAEKPLSRSTIETSISGITGPRKANPNNARVIVEFVSTGGIQRKQEAQSNEPTLVLEILAAYWRFAQEYYLKDGQTLRWSADKAPGKSTPYHCDGIFVPSSWKSGIICEVLTSTSFEVSDHYPVAAWVSH